jgi:hypothetical protein
MSAFIEALYEAAARSGLLVRATVGAVEVDVDFYAPDEDILDGLAVSRNQVIRYPASRLSLATGDELTINGESYRVREVRQVGDGSECRATLTRIT